MDLRNLRFNITLVLLRVCSPVLRATDAREFQHHTGAIEGNARSPQRSTRTPSFNTTLVLLRVGAKTETP